MNSKLKILVDSPCEVYCDYELKGKAVPQSIFRIELRKGTYILEFKQNGNILYSQDYIMQSNDEEDLLKISLLEIVNNTQLEETTQKIEKLNVSIVFHDKKYWLKNLDDETENEIRYDIHNKIFDVCGLLHVYKGVLDEYGFLEKGGLYGCINKIGEIQIPIKFDQINPFENPYVTTAVLNGRTVFINKWGKLAFENIYSSAYCYWKSFCVVKKDKKNGVINEKGEVVVPVSYDSIEYDRSGEHGFILTVDKKKGLCGFDGSTIIPLLYDDIKTIRKGLILVRKDNLCGIVNDKDEAIIPMEYDNIEYCSWNLYGFIVTRNGKMGLKGTDGSAILPIEYDDIQKWQYCSFLLVTKNGKKGVYKENGECIIKIKYNNCKICACDSFVVSIDGKEGLFYNGKLILDIKYDIIKRLYESLILVYDGDYWHIYDIQSEKFLNILFNDYEEGFDNQFIVSFQNYYNVYDYKKREYLFDKYDEIKCSLNGDCYIVVKDGKKGLNNVEGEIIYSTKFDDIQVYEELVVALMNRYVVIYDYDGNILMNKTYRVPPSFLRGNVLGWASDECFQASPVLRNGKWGCLNKDFFYLGKIKNLNLLEEIVPCEYDFIAYQDKTLVTNAENDKDQWIKYFVKQDVNGDLHYYYCEYDYKEEKAIIAQEWIKPNNNTYYLFFDTETTGTPLNYNALSSDTRNWPRLVELGWILMTENGEKIVEKNYIIKPKDFIIPIESTRIHKITMKMASEQGHDLSFVLDEFLKDFKKAKFIVGHNIEFDKKIVGAELVRLSKPDVMDTKEALCTMESSLDFCKIPGKSGYKYPKLQELYKLIFGHDYEEAHNALSDIEATQQCFWELRKKKLI